MLPSPFAFPILVLGDLILDEYLVGRATRLSREAAVPVLERSRRELLPGGACNPAVGIVALGGQATMAGVVGADEAGATLRERLAARGVATSGLLIDPTRPTTTKTRIVAEGGFVYGQHLARIDHLERRSLDEGPEAALIELVRHQAPAHLLLLVSDYKNGVITPALLAALRAQRAETGQPLVVDSQGDLERFEGFDLVKCNRAEAEHFLGDAFPVADDATRAATLARLRERSGARAVVVTLGGAGIAWLDEEGHSGLSRAPRAEVYDVTGAGDTVIAVLALARAAGWSLARGCALAAQAAARTVRVMGNYAPTWAELSAVATRGDASDRGSEGAE